MRLANPRDPEFMKKHLLYRRAFNYSRGLAANGQLDVGLVFICYQANLADGFIFVQNLLNGEPLEEYISRLAAAISSSCRVSKKAASSAKSFLGV